MREWMSRIVFSFFCVMLLGYLGDFLSGKKIYLENIDVFDVKSLRIFFFYLMWLFCKYYYFYEMMKVILEELFCGNV